MSDGSRSQADPPKDPIGPGPSPPDGPAGLHQDVDLKALAVGEVAIGSALLLPVVPNRLAGVALTALGIALLGVYARTPGMRQEGSIWPTPQGMALGKDVWLAAIGAGLLLDRD